MSFVVTLLALAIDASVGYPQWLLSHIGHPVTWLGALISRLDARLNRPEDRFGVRKVKGFLALIILILATLTASALLEDLCRASAYGWLVLAIASSSLLAQRSLYGHVLAVASALEVSLEAGREAVAKIVGRNAAMLDEAGVARAAIESLAESFSDGVVAPAFFLALFGLPGAAIYKAVNTADSMIGHLSPRYAAFGYAAAKLDDFLNLIPSRLSAALLTCAAALFPQASISGALKTALRDAPRHLSPNAGWPESAMAGALGLSLGGPRVYGDQTVDGARLGDGRAAARVEDIQQALKLYRLAAIVFWGLLALAAFWTT